MSIKTSLLTAIIFTSLMVFLLYGFFIEPNHVKLRTVIIQNKVMASTFKGLKIVQLSDLHCGDVFSTALKQTLLILNELQPDLILLTGDYVEWNGNTQAYNKAINFLSQLSAPLGIYAVMGDADYSFSRKSCEFCHKSGSELFSTKHQVRFLRNDQVIIENNMMKFSIVGIDTNPELTLTPEDINTMLTNIPTILLSHTSLIYSNLNTDKNILILSGDTHGGQIYLPNFLWRIIKRKDDPKHMYGLYREKNKSLYVTSGIGTSDLPFRIGMPPEIILFEFKD